MAGSVGRVSELIPRLRRYYILALCRSLRLVVVHRFPGGLLIRGSRREVASGTGLPVASYQTVRSEKHIDLPETDVGWRLRPNGTVQCLRDIASRGGYGCQSGPTLQRRRGPPSFSRGEREGIPAGALPVD